MNDSSRLDTVIDCLRRIELLPHVCGEHVDYGICGACLASIGLQEIREHETPA